MSSTQKLIYASEDAYFNIKENFTATILSSMTVACTIAILAIFIIIFFNLRSTVEGWGERTHIIAYVEDGVSGSTLRSLEANVKAAGGVKEVGYVSKADALKNLSEELSEHSAIFEGVKKDILPASFEIKVTEEFRDPAKIMRTVKALKRLKGLSEVQYGQEQIEQLASFLKFFEFTALSLGVFFSAAVIFIISNTVRMTVYARKDSIEVMRQVGASETYIKVPFFIEGLLMGVLGGVLALVVLYFARYFFIQRTPEFLSFLLVNPFTPLMLIGILFVTGVALGSIGSLVSMRKFLRI